MYTRQITSEQQYTLSEARKIIEKEKKEKKEIFLCMIKQKTLGFLAISVSIAELIMGYYNLIDEGGGIIIMLPIGIWLLFTRENIIYSGKEEGEMQ